MSFVSDCVSADLPVWRECLDTPFLRGIADGTLPVDCFKGYIVDDTLYLREYARVFGWGILHAEDSDQIRSFYSLLSFVNETEDSTRLYYLRRYGLRDETIQKLPLRPQNRAYVEEMLTAAREAEGPAECMMAALPCMLSYSWIFGQMLRTAPRAASDPEYGPFVRDYAGGGYDALCGEWRALADRWCTDLSDVRRARCRAIFHACSLHELHFWQMSGEPRTDL